MCALPLAFLLAGCAPPPYEPEIVYIQDTAGDTQDTPPDTDPSIAFLSPESEAEIVGCGFVVFETLNYTLVDNDAMPELREGYGHIHLYYPLANDQNEPTGANGYELCSSNSCIWDPNEGETVFHSGGITQIVASLRDNDHGEILDDDGENVSATLDVRFTDGLCELLGETADTAGTEGDSGGAG